MEALLKQVATNDERIRQLKLNNLSFTEMKEINYYDQLMEELGNPSEQKVIGDVLRHLVPDTRERICNMVVANLRFGIPVMTGDSFILATTVNILTLHKMFNL